MRLTDFCMDELLRAVQNGLPSNTNAAFFASESCSRPSAIGSFELTTSPYDRSPRRRDPSGPDRSGQRNTGWPVGSDLRADRQPLVALNLGPHRATGRLGDATLPVPTALGDATRSGGRVRSPSGPSAIGRLECCKTHHFLRNMFLKTKTPQDVSIRTSGLRYW